MAVIAELFDNYESGRAEITKQGMTATRVILSDDYADWTSDAPGYGDAHPNDATLIATRITMQGWGKPIGAIGAPDYEYAKITIQYSTAGMETDGEPIASGEFGAEVLEVGGGRTWVSDSEPVDIPINITYGYERLILEKAYLTLPYANIAACVNKVNNANWTPSGQPRTIAAGCALMMSPRWRQELSGMTGVRVQVSYEFLIRPQSWNLVYRADTGAWDRTDPVLYATANFGTLGLST